MKGKGRGIVGRRVTTGRLHWTVEGVFGDGCLSIVRDDRAGRIWRTTVARSEVKFVKGDYTR